MVNCVKQRNNTRKVIRVRLLTSGRQLSLLSPEPPIRARACAAAGKRTPRKPPVVPGWNRMEEPSHPRKSPIIFPTGIVFPLTTTKNNNNRFRSVSNDWLSEFPVSKGEGKSETPLQSAHHITRWPSNNPVNSKPTASV